MLAAFYPRELATLGYWIDGDLGDYLYALAGLVLLAIAIVLIDSNRQKSKAQNRSYVAPLMLIVIGIPIVFTWGIFSLSDLLQTVR